MATSALTSRPLNPNAQPWLHFLPCHVTYPSYADMAPTPLPLTFHYTPTQVVPYYCHVAPSYNYIYYVSPVVVQPPPPQQIVASDRHFRRSAGKGRKTTVMIKNIPNQFSRDMLVDFLDQVCRDQNSRYEFHSRQIPFEYDFMYLPFDFERGYNLGYAFVNFTTPFVADKIWRLLGGYVWGTFMDGDNNWRESKKICEITWARIQGTHELVRHFKNSRFICDNINYLPVLFTPPRDGSVSQVSPTTIGSLSGFAPHGHV